MVMQPMQSPTPGDSSFIRFAEWAASALGGAVLGFLGALTTFKTKLVLNDRNLETHKEATEKALDAHRTAVNDALKQMADALASRSNSLTAEAMRAERALRDSLDALRKENDERHEENRAQFRFIKRQSFLTLKAIADIAKINGTDKRSDDVIWKLLADAQEDAP